MEQLEALFNLYGAGAAHVFSPNALMLICFGSLLGIFFGAMPGLSSTMALALFTPLTFAMSASDAIVFLIAIYINSVYAGALTAILINIPGTPSSIMTGLDGHPLAQRGEAGRAIGLATFASFWGGLIGLIVLMTVSPLMAEVALQFGSWEFAMLALLGLTLISYLGGANIVFGLTGATLGLLLSTVGGDPILGYPRFAFGSAELSGGINIVVPLIGLFGFAEIFSQLEVRGKVNVAQKIVGMWSAFGETRHRVRQIFQGAIVGTLIGILPGVGGSIGSVVAYGLARRTSKTPDDFGRGSTEGLTAAESANNACVGGALVPMMTMGIPGDPMTAVLIGALMIHGLAPGPALYAKAPEFVSSIFLGYFVALVIMLVAGLLLARPFARLIAFPRHLVLSIVAVLCVLGTYSIQNSMFDVGLSATIGFVGFLLRKVDIQPAPIVLGIVLGPIVEHNLRRAILLSEGDLTSFATRPLSAALLIIILVIVFAPLLTKLGPSAQASR